MDPLHTILTVDIAVLLIRLVIKMGAQTAAERAFGLCYAVYIQFSRRIYRAVPQCRLDKCHSCRHSRYSGDNPAAAYRKLLYVRASP